MQDNMTRCDFSHVFLERASTTVVGQPTQQSAPEVSQSWGLRLLTTRHKSEPDSDIVSFRFSPLIQGGIKKKTTALPADSKQLKLEALNPKPEPHLPLPRRK